MHVKKKYTQWCVGLESEGSGHAQIIILFEVSKFLAMKLIRNLEKNSTSLVNLLHDIPHTKCNGINLNEIVRNSLLHAHVVINHVMLL